MSRKLQLDSAITADIQTVNADSYIDSLKMIDVENIEPNKANFYEISEIEALADDIERQGLMTALVVSELNGGKYQLISGHRRLAAIKQLIEDGRRRNGKIPCFIKGAKPKTETELDLYETASFLPFHICRYARSSRSERMREAFAILL